MEYNCKCFCCSKPIYRKPSFVKKYTKFYCSRKCKSQQDAQLTTKVKVKCSFCDKVIEKTRFQLRSSKTGLSFCDNQCKNTYIARNSRWTEPPQDHRSRKKRLIEVTKGCCQQCGDTEDERMLDLHHNDGNHNNNEWSNLRIVCVWCHQKHHRCGMQLILPCLLDDSGKLIQGVA